MLPNDYSRCATHDCPLRHECARTNPVSENAVMTVMTAYRWTMTEYGPHCDDMIPAREDRE